MTKDEKLDEFLKRIGIELLPFQKEFIKKIADENKIYVCFPPHVGRYESLRLIQALANVFEKGEQNYVNYWRISPRKDIQFYSVNTTVRTNFIFGYPKREPRS